MLIGSLPQVFRGAYVWPPHWCPHQPPQTPTGIEALGIKLTQLKWSALSLVSFEHPISLFPSLPVHAGAPQPNIDNEFCLELCALRITCSFYSKLEVRSHVMLLTVPARTFNADSLHIWTTAKMMIHQQRWWNICQVFKIQQYINVLPGDVNANIGYYL